MFAGPIIVREVITAPRPLRFYVARASYVGLLFILMWTAWQSRVGFAEITEIGLISYFGHLLFRWFVLFQLTLMMFFAPLFRPESEIVVWGPASPEASLRERIGRYISAPLAPVEFASHPGLRLLYAERLAQHEKPGWFPAGPAMESVELVWQQLGRDTKLLIAARETALALAQNTDSELDE